jgi:cell division topological specificity factor
MNIFRLFCQRRQPSAPEAKERLQILLAHERAGTGQPEYLPRLHRDILKAVGKYVEINTDKIQVTLSSEGNVSKLAVDIELPSTRDAWRPAALRAEKRKPQRTSGERTAGAALPVT